MNAYLSLTAMIYRAWRYRLGRDREQIRLLRECLQPGMTAIDIGAHKGAYTYWMCRAVGPGGKVIAFEPQPLLAQLLAEALPLLGSVQVEQKGVSSAPGVAVLHVPGGGKPSPGATFESGLVQGVETCLENLTLVTLDQYFSDHPVHLIKCDVEGHELDVFRGGEALLKRHKPWLLFECEARHQKRHTMGEVFEYLAGLGYQGSFFLAGGMHPVSQFRENMQDGPPKGTGYVNNFFFSPAHH